MEGEKETDAIAKERIRNMLAFVSSWYEEISEILGCGSTKLITKLVKVGSHPTRLREFLRGSHAEPDRVVSPPIAVPPLTASAGR